MKLYSTRTFFYKITAIFLISCFILGSISFSSRAETSSPEQDAPDVIVIMNESFFDPSVLGNVPVNEDFLPFYHSLEEYTGQESNNLLKGTLHVSDVGGNSTNTEFEFLTGNSMAFLSPMRSPYSQYLNPDSEYIPALFRQSGYKTVSIYPYKNNSWNRNLAYSIMDFSESYFEDSFSSAQRIRNYVSDTAVYEKALQLCEETTQPIFIFCSTIQNHSSYQKIYSNFTPSVKASNTESNSLNQYLSLLKESDKALEYLIDRVSSSSRKTMVVFFGNHQPNNYLIEAMFHSDLSPDSSKTASDIRYTVPYFIWANFDLTGYSMPDTSPSLLGNMVLEISDIELNTFQEFLNDFKTIIPAISSQGYMDQNGIFHSFTIHLERNTQNSEEFQYINLYHDLVEESRS